MHVPKRILIIDDEQRILFVLRHALSRLGPHYQVTAFDNSLMALEAARNTRFDLVVTDLQMPGMDGIALTEALRALDDAPAVIWMTAHDCRARARDAERLGIHRCLDKPLELADIRHAVCEALWGACPEGEKEAVTHV